MDLDIERYLHQRNENSLLPPMVAHHTKCGDIQALILVMNNIIFLFAFTGYFCGYPEKSKKCPGNEGDQNLNLLSNIGCFLYGFNFLKFVDPLETAYTFFSIFNV